MITGGNDTIGSFYDFIFIPDSDALAADSISQIPFFILVTRNLFFQVLYKSIASTFWNVQLLNIVEKLCRVSNALLEATKKNEKLVFRIFFVVFNNF